MKKTINRMLSDIKFNERDMAFLKKESLKEISYIEQSIKADKLDISFLEKLGEEFPSLERDYSLNFIDKLVNKSNTNIKFEFKHDYGYLTVCKFTYYSYNNKKFKVYASSFNQKDVKNLTELNFDQRHTLIIHPLPFSKKDIKNYKGDLVNRCNKEIIKWIQKSPNHKIDSSSKPNPELKKLLLLL